MNHSTGFTTPAALAALCVAIAACSGATTDSSVCADPGVDFSPSAPAVQIADAVPLTATYALADAACGHTAPASQLVWTSSDPSVATVNAGGVVSGVAHGAAWIRVAEPGAAAPLDSIRVLAYQSLYNRIVFGSIPPVPCAAPEACVPQIRSIWPGGSELQVVADAIQWPEHPSVSRDGRHIVFEDAWKLYIADAADGSVRPLETGLAQSFEPTWSEDGEQILFSGVMQSGGGRLIYLINPDGSGRRLVNSSSEVSGLFSPTWSPDGTEVGFVAPLSNGFDEGVAVNVATGARRSLTSGLPQLNVWAIRWSPDGSALMSLDVSSGGWTINRLDLATGDYQVIITGGGNRPGEWSPDGQSIAYGAGDLYIADRNGGNPRRILHDARTNFELTWAPLKPSN